MQFYRVISTEFMWWPGSELVAERIWLVTLDGGGECIDRESEFMLCKL